MFPWRISEKSKLGKHQNFNWKIDYSIGKLHLRTFNPKIICFPNDRSHLRPYIKEASLVVIEFDPHAVLIHTFNEEFHWSHAQLPYRFMYWVNSLSVNSMIASTTSSSSTAWYAGLLATSAVALLKHIPRLMSLSRLLLLELPPHEERVAGAGALLDLPTKICLESPMTI